MSTSSFHHPSLKILWQAVTSEPMDFQSWTALLSQVKLLYREIFVFVSLIYAQPLFGTRRIRKSG